MAASPNAFYQPREIGPLVAEGVSVFGRCWLTLTRPIIGPVLLQIVGIGLALALPFLVIDWATAHPEALSRPMLWGAFLLSIAPGMGLFMWSFWRYVVWISALNLVVRDCVEIGYCPDPEIHWLRVGQRAVDYSLVWLFFFALCFVPVGLGLLTLSLADMLQIAPVVRMMLGVLALGTTGIVGLVTAFACALVFQVFAFTPSTAGAALFRSADLVKLAPGKTLLLLVLVGFLTQGLFPALGLGAFDLLGLTNLLGNALYPWVQHVLETNHASWQASGMLSSQGAQAFKLLLSNSKALCVEIARTTLMSVLSALMLPLASVWMALWYGSLKDRQDQEEAALKSNKPISVR